MATEPTLPAESVAPKVCLYCDGKGNGPGAPCGFCDSGKPLDTQEDWDQSWGRVLGPLPDWLVERIEANRADPSRTVKRSERHFDGSGCA